MTVDRPRPTTCFTRTALVSSRARRESRLELTPVSIVIFPYARMHDGPLEISVCRDIKSAMRVHSITEARGISLHS